MAEARHLSLSLYEHDGYEIAHVRAGHRGVKRIVPPAGERYAFDVDQWARRIEVSVSPTGRSIRIYVDGREVRP
jgi:hypothetical protein